MSYTVKLNLSGLAPAQAQAPARSYDLFATRIWQFHLETLSVHHAAWEARVNELRALNPEPAGRTVRNGWNSDDFTLLDDPVFAALNGEVRAQTQSALSQMGQADLSFAVQSWINLHERGGFNFAHMHDGCYLSGCYYLKVPEGSGSLVFRDPRPGTMHGLFKGGGVNAYKDVKLKPYAGLLVLFPSWLEHFVEPHDSDESRIVIAFNALP